MSPASATRPAARALNFGDEQSRLDGLPGARAGIVALKPPGEGTPHLELLGYHPPGRASRETPRDVAATRTVLEWDGTSPPGIFRGPDGHLVAVEGGVKGP